MYVCVKMREIERERDVLFCILRARGGIEMLFLLLFSRLFMIFIIAHVFVYIYMFCVLGIGRERETKMVLVFLNARGGIETGIFLNKNFFSLRVEESKCGLFVSSTYICVYIYIYI
jgi:hypothetical protein